MLGAQHLAAVIVGFLPDVAGFAVIPAEPDQARQAIPENKDIRRRESLDALLLAIVLPLECFLLEILGSLIVTGEPVVERQVILGSQALTVPPAPDLLVQLDRHFVQVLRREEITASAQIRAHRN